MFENVNEDLGGQGRNHALGGPVGRMSHKLDHDVVIVVVAVAVVVVGQGCVGRGEMFVLVHCGREEGKDEEGLKVQRVHVHRLLLYAKCHTLPPSMKDSILISFPSQDPNTMPPDELYGCHGQNRLNHKNSHIYLTQLEFRSWQRRLARLGQSKMIDYGNSR